MIAPSPAMIVPFSMTAGATMAVVTPAIRLTGMSIERGLIAGVTSNDAVNCRPSTERSLVCLTPETSSMPNRLIGSNSPGVTIFPVPSMRVAPAGTAAPAPTASIFPSRRTTVACSIFPGAPSVYTVAFVIAYVSPRAGEDNAKPQRAAAARIPGSFLRVIARLPCCRAKNRARLAARIVPVVRDRAVDENFFRLRIDAERVRGPDHDVGHLPGSERTGLLVDPQRARRVEGHPLDGPSLRDLQAGAATRRPRLGHFLVQPLDPVRIVGMDHRAGAARVDHRDVLRNAVPGFHLEAPPVRPHRRAGSVSRSRSGIL